jgi:radical SAM protein with 4Fe4S-binding SPASM domain
MSADPSAAPPGELIAVRRGHRPSCSSAGSVVGVALLSLGAASLILNSFADLFTAWRSGGGPPGPPPRLRPEADGGGRLALPQGDVLELNPDGVAAARRAGATEVGAAAPAAVTGALRAPEEAHLAVTDRCPAACAGCYLDAGPHRAGQVAAALGVVIDELADLGVLELAFGGGEALLRGDLVALAHRARARGLVPNLTTSGFGLSPARAAELAAVFGQINVSIDGLEGTYAEARGWEGAAQGRAAVRALVAAGARVGVNTVMSRPLLETPGALEALGAAIAEDGATEWQWLRFKPAGRGAAAWDQLAPPPALLDGLWPRALAVEAAGRLRLRWDCALVPFLVDHGVDPEALRLLGVRGCTAGQDLWSRHADGRWAGCSFLPGAPAEGALSAAWATAPELQALRERPQAEPCASCPVAATCRGGCRVVSAHLAGDAAAPDPECPRVRRWEAARVG